MGAQSNISRAQSDLRQIKHSAGGEVKFAVLSKIVRFMRQRHMEGLEHPLTLEDILDESRQVSGQAARFSYLKNHADILGFVRFELSRESKYSSAYTETYQDICTMAQCRTVCIYFNAPNCVLF